MRLICTQENLDRSLMYLERITGKQSTLPILNNVLLETEKGRLKISATNLEIGAVAYVGAKIEKEGKIALSAKILSGFIHNLPGGDVLELSLEDSVLCLKSAGYQMKIKGLDGKDFPLIPVYKKEYPFVFPAQSLKTALSKLLFCVGINEARMELTGVNISLRENALYLAATDSFRLGEAAIWLSNTDGIKTSIPASFSQLIVPGSVLQEVGRMITPETEGVKIALEENQIFFALDEILVVSRLINGKYPEYQQIVPKEYSLNVLFSKEELSRAVRIAGAFSSYGSGEVALSFDPAKKICTITSESQEIGENRAILSAEFLSGQEPLDIVFNARYVLEGLNALSGERVVCSANTPSTPAAFRAYDEARKTGDASYFYLIMPIRK